MTATSVLPLVRRFRSVARQDGVGSATLKASRYLARRLRGGGASALNRSRIQTPAQPERYLHGIWRSLAQGDAFHISAAPAVHRNKRQIAMIADLNLPQCRKYRVEQLAHFWRARDVEFEFAHFQDIPRAVRLMQQATHLMEYRLQSGPATDMLRYEARRLRLPVLYDLDDPLFSVSAYETYGNMSALDPALKDHFLGEAPRYLNMMNGADILSVSTPGMAAHAGLYTNRAVHVRRNFADDMTLAAGNTALQQPAPDDGLFRVAFASGSQGHEADLERILEPLTEFILDRDDRRLMLLGHFKLTFLPAALRDRVEVTGFGSYDGYLAALGRANCAIMPLSDDIFNSCKSAVRVIDASAVAVPSIVSRVGDLPNVVRSGQTGFVAATPTGWRDALETFGEEPEAAREMGRAARTDLVTRWAASDHPHIIAPDLIDWVEG